MMSPYFADICSMAAHRSSATMLIRRQASLHDAILPRKILAASFKFHELRHAILGRPISPPAAPAAALMLNAPFITLIHIEAARFRIAMRASDDNNFPTRRQRQRSTALRCQRALYKSPHCFRARQKAIKAMSRTTDEFILQKIVSFLPHAASRSSSCNAH